MKLFPKVRLQASNDRFIFSCGSATFQFKPEVYLATDNVVLAIGAPPLKCSAARVVRPLDLTENRSEIGEVLAMLFRHGLREVLGRWCLGPLTLNIACDPSINFLSPTDWRQAASRAGAGKVIVESSVMEAVDSISHRAAKAADQAFVASISHIPAAPVSETWDQIR